MFIQISSLFPKNFLIYSPLRTNLSIQIPSLKVQKSHHKKHLPFYKNISCHSNFIVHASIFYYFLFSFSPPSHSNTKCHTTHPNISYHYHQYAPSPTLFSSFLTRPFANINSLFPLSLSTPSSLHFLSSSLSSLNTFYSIIHHSH